MSRDESPAIDLAQAFKSHVLCLAHDEKFIHRSWYIEYHLNIVEKIAMELTEIYPEADRNFVMTLVWLHDYGKFIDWSRQYELTLTEGRRALTDAGFSSKFSDRAIEYARLLDDSQRTDLSKAPIEVQIVSSADGCAHFVGPFFQIWLWENSGRPLRELLRQNRSKAEKDWTRKIVLPEARAAFEQRYRIVCEQNGDLPSSYIVPERLPRPH
jgi:hypothetical protein